jgi:RecB family exonuclease
VSPPTEAVDPVRPEGQPLVLSGSSLEGLVSCPLRWFLEHEVRAVTSRGTALGFGSVVHAIADGVATEQVEADLEVLVARIDTVWRQLQFGAVWESDQQREDARSAVARFLAWHQADRGRTLVASEQGFSVDLSVGGRTVRLRGRLDRVELDADGRVVVVDFKTGRATPSQPEVDQHLQLAVYQRAVREGVVTEAGSEPGGAELVQLRVPKGDGPKVQHQAPPSAEHGFLDDALAEAVRILDAEDFRPQPSTACDRCAYRRVCPAQDEGRGLVP